MIKMTRHNTEGLIDSVDMIEPIKVKSLEEYLDFKMKLGAKFINIIDIDKEIEDLVNTKYDLNEIFNTTSSAIGVYSSCKCIKNYYKTEESLEELQELFEKRKCSNEIILYINMSHGAPLPDDTMAMKFKIDIYTFDPSNNNPFILPETPRRQYSFSRTYLVGRDGVVRNPRLTEMDHIQYYIQNNFSYEENDYGLIIDKKRLKRDETLENKELIMKIETKIVNGLNIAKLTTEDYVIVNLDNTEIISNVDKSDAQLVMVSEYYLTPDGWIMNTSFKSILGDDESEEFLDQVGNLPDKVQKTLLYNYIKNSDILKYFEKQVEDYANKHNFIKKDIVLEDIDDLVLKYDLENF